MLSLHDALPIWNVRFVSDFFTGRLDDMPEKMYGLAECVRSVCETLKEPIANFQIDLHSSIPIGRGLGSSAAIAVSLVRGLYNFCKKDLDREVLKKFVDLAEKYAHGNLSGIDREGTRHDQDRKSTRLNSSHVAISS